MSCTSRNLIYILLCNGCKEIYVGETGDMLRMRLNVHRQHILHCENAPLRVSSHINTCGRGRNILDKFSILPIFKISPYVHNPNFRKEKENHFIHLLKPKLNATVDWTCNNNIKILCTTYTVHRESPARETPVRCRCE